MFQKIHANYLVKYGEIDKSSKVHNNVHTHACAHAHTHSHGVGLLTMIHSALVCLFGGGLWGVKFEDSWAAAQETPRLLCEVLLICSLAISIDLPLWRQLGKKGSK